MAHLNSMTANAKRSAIALAIVVGLVTWVGWRRTDAQSTPAPAPGAAPTAGGETPVPGATPTGTTATIEFMTSPAVQATVTWGDTRLGRIAPGEPLVVVRPRDSGPLDVVIRAQGYLPVTTRAHTFTDNKMMVKLTSPAQRHTLHGYRAPIDAGVPQVQTEDVPSSLFYAPPGAAGAGQPQAQ